MVTPAHFPFLLVGILFSVNNFDILLYPFPFIYNENIFQDTKPTWTLSDDNKTYSKTFDKNQTYSTPFTDSNGNMDMIEINVNQIDETPPEITFNYILNEDNSVTVTAISNEALKNTKPTWTLSDDNLSYLKTFYTNQNYSTTFTDKHGNSKNYSISFNSIIINYEITYEYNEQNNTVTVKIISKVPLKNTKPTWSLNNDNTIFTKTFYTNQNYFTPIEDTHGNIENININFDLIK